MNLYNTKYIIWISLAVICFVGFVACKKNNDSPENALAKELSNYSASYWQRAYAIKLNGIAYGDSTVSYRGFPVSLSQPAAQEMEVKAAIDTSLIDAYNALYNEKNPKFDTAAFSLSFGGKYRIAADSTTSADSLYIRLKSATKLADSTVFLIPVRLTANNGATVKTSIVFFKMFVAPAYIDAYINNGTSPGFASPYNRYGSLFFSYVLSKDANGNLVVPAIARMSAFARQRFPMGSLHVYGGFDISDSLVQAVSKNTGLSYKPFPTGTYRMIKEMATIAPNTYVSADSLTVGLQNYDAFSKGTYYLLGVKIISKKEDVFSAPPINQTSSYAMISVYINP